MGRRPRHHAPAAGASRRRVADALGRKGVPGELVGRVLGAEGEGTELAAARAYARKRHLGPWRRPPPAGAVDPELRRHELARLARQGFSYAVASEVVDGEVVDGEVADGEVADGEVADGGVFEGAAVDGEA